MIEWTSPLFHSIIYLLTDLFSKHSRCLSLFLFFTFVFQSFFWSVHTWRSPAPQTGHRLCYHIPWRSGWPGSVESPGLRGGVGWAWSLDCCDYFVGQFCGLLKAADFRSMAKGICKKTKIHGCHFVEWPLPLPPFKFCYRGGVSNHSLQRCDWCISYHQGASGTQCCMRISLPSLWRPLSV